MSIKTNLIWFGAALVSLFLALFKIEKGKNKNLKLKSVNRELKSKVRQNTIQDRAETQRAAAAKEGQKRVETDIADAKRGTRRRFD